MNRFAMGVGTVVGFVLVRRAIAWLSEADARQYALREHMHQPAHRPARREAFHGIKDISPGRRLGLT